MSGRLIYVMGPSGAGKDSVLRAARLAAPPRLWFAHRYITRPADDASENHVALSDAEFAARRDAGGFALHWESHGWRYGIGIEIDAWMASGSDVVVNGSRAAFDAAHGRYPALLPVLLTASPEILRARLAARGRESAEALEARLVRNAGLAVRHPRLVTIANDGTLEDAAHRFLYLTLLK
ncbi:MAG: phosphonate metabolism protein/1,5-bisphosphokinase (PRPP-forming) PhnN [Rhodospirillaceae bacterium]